VRNQQVAEAVRTIRGSTGLSQWDFAHRFEIPIRALQNWEQGITLPDFDGLSHLIKVAGADAYHLFKAMGIGNPETIDQNEQWTHIAVTVIFERAPEAIKAKLIDILEEWAGKYGAPPSPMKALPIKERKEQLQKVRRKP